jgi:hypothetical protein
MHFYGDKLENSNARITACSKVKTTYGNNTMSNEQNESDAKAHPVDTLVMCGVMEYCEEMPVTLRTTTGVYAYGVSENDYIGRGRLVVKALNEAGYNSTQVDLLQLLKWVAENKPEIYMKNVTHEMMRLYT